MIYRIPIGAQQPNGDPGTEGTPVAIEGAYVAPRSSSDVDGEGRNGAVVGLTLYHRDPDLPISRTDLFVIDQDPSTGSRWSIVGEVGRWHRGLSGRKGGLEVALTRGEG